MKPVTVAELIDHLLQFPPDTPVAYRKFSEQCLLGLDEVQQAQLQPVRPDGWVHDARPDAPSIPYVLFPGN